MAETVARVHTHTHTHTQGNLVNNKKIKHSKCFIKDICERWRDHLSFLCAKTNINMQKKKEVNNHFTNEW